MSAGVNLCLVWILFEYSWRAFCKILCNDACERPSSWEHLWKDFFRIFHRIHIVRTSCSQFPARSGIFWLFVEVVYLSCDLKFVYQIINLAFLGIIIKVNLPAKFCLPSFEWYYLHISSDAKYFFLSCPRYCDWGLIVVIVYYFQIWSKKRTQHYY